MKYLLDTNAVSDFFDDKREGHESVVERIAHLKNEDILQVSVLTLCEFKYGSANADQEKKEKKENTIQSLNQMFEILPLPVSVASVYGELKKKFKDIRQVSRENLKKHNIDLLIACTSITESSILVTSDTIYHDLAKLNSKLTVQNWLI